MTMPSIAQFLAEACDELRAELHKLDRQIVVGHNFTDTIEVFAKPEFKAYIPKTYDGWTVRWADSSGTEFIDLDQLLSAG